MENPTCILHISLDPSQKEQVSGCQEFIVRPTCRRLKCMTPSFFLSPTGMPTRAPGRNQACPSRHPEETNIPSLQASACNSQTPHFTWNVKTNWPDDIMLSIRCSVLAGFITWNFRITHDEMNLRKRHGFNGSQNCPVREGKTALLPWAEETNLEKTRCKITNWRESGRQVGYDQGMFYTYVKVSEELKILFKNAYTHGAEGENGSQPIHKKTEQSTPPDNISCQIYSVLHSQTSLLSQLRKGDLAWASQWSISFPNHAWKFTLPEF